MKLIWDLDSSLADLMSPWMVWLHQKGIAPKVHDLHEVRTYDWMWKTYGPEVNGFFHDDPEHTYKNHVLPFNGAKEMMEWSQEHFDEVEIVTHSGKKETEIAKTEWVIEYLNFDKIRFFGDLNNKFKYIEDSILVDDYPLHCIRHAGRNGCPSVLFDHNEENGWSKLENYQIMMEVEKANPDMIRYASSYRSTKQELLQLKEYR